MLIPNQSIGSNRCGYRGAAIPAAIGASNSIVPAARGGGSLRGCLERVV
jgi:hypothetical protein